jgi:hypothetical protein
MKKLIKPPPVVLLVIFIFLNLLIGLWIAPDFGRSSDEQPERSRSALAYQFYSNEVEIDPYQAYLDLGIIRHYGTSSTVIIRWVEDLVSPYFQEKVIVDHNLISHYMYFVFFQAGILGFYWLIRQFIDDWAALGATLLFGTQPLLIGHAFMNPKDIPLLTVFLLTVASGFSLIDQLSKRNQARTEEQINHSAVVNTEDITIRKKQKLYSFIFFMVAAMLLSRGWLQTQFLNLVEYAYNSRETSLIGQIFSYLTTSGSLEGYQILAMIKVNQVFRWINSIGLGILCYLFYDSGRKQLFGGFLNLKLFFAAMIWGVAISTRVLAVTAGGMVGIYGLYKLRKNGLIPLVSYTVLATVSSFITWPYLWFFGLRGFLDALLEFSDYSFIPKVFFEGQYYLANQLPVYFLPKTMLLQFTEPMVLLFGAGIFVSLVLLIKNKIDRAKLLLIVAWFGLPMGYTLIAGSPNYNNFRQYFFITPPLFILAGLALQQIKNKLANKYWTVGLFAVILIPALISIVSLHPYQYVYYNQFTGGVRGASNQYEMDYWGLSYKEAMDYANLNIPEGSTVLVWGNVLRAQFYENNDLGLTASYNTPEDDWEHFDYYIIPVSRHGGDSEQIDSTVIYQAMVRGIPLMLVRQNNITEP